MALQSNIVEIMRNDIEKLKKLHDECFYAPGSKEKHFNDWKRALTEYGEYYHCSDFEMLNACYEEARRPPVEKPLKKKKTQKKKKYAPASEPAERSGCLLAFIIFSIYVSCSMILTIVSNSRKDAPVGCLIFMFLGSVAVIGMMIERYLHPKPKPPVSYTGQHYSPSFSEEDNRLAEGLAIGYAIHKYGSDGSKPFYQYSPYYLETADDGYEVGYEDGLSGYEIDVDESSPFGQGYAEGFDDGSDDAEW